METRGDLLLILALALAIVGLPALVAARTCPSRLARALLYASCLLAAASATIAASAYVYASVISDALFALWLALVAWAAGPESTSTQL